MPTIRVPLYGYGFMGTVVFLPAEPELEFQVCGGDYWEWLIIRENVGGVVGKRKRNSY
jgi:hypothetical protein